MPSSNDPITVQVISRDDGLVGHLLALAASCEREGGVPCRVNHVEQPEEELEGSPGLVLIDLDSMTDGALDDIPRLREHGARGFIVVAYRDPSPDRLLKAMRAGANDYLSTYPTIEEFTGLLTRALEAAGPSGARPRGRLMTVFSNKGGVGTTMVTINVAAAVAAQLAGPVVVVDLVLQRGDVSVFLDVPTGYTVTSLSTELDRADPSYLKSVLPRHRAGMYVLPAPVSPDEAELVTPVQIARMLQMLRATFDAVIVDAGNEMNEFSLAALDAADRQLLVTLPSLPSVRNTKRSLDLIERLRYDPAKLMVIVNRSNAKEKLSRDTMEEALGRQVQWSIPNDYLAVTRAINQGTALRAIQPRGEMALNFDRLAATHVLARANGISAARERPRPRAFRAVQALFRGGTDGTP